LDEGAAVKPFVLAHLSDPHLGPLPQPDVRELASKRLLGYINWRRRRHRVHRADALDAIMRDLRGERPDHVVVTGDLVNIALPAEFAQARRWLEGLGRPADVSVVPGNHDAYVAAAGPHRDRYWSPYMAGDDALSGSVKREHEDPHAPSPLVGEGRGGGSGDYGNAVPPRTTPTPDPSPEEGGARTLFPYLRRRGPVALIGVSTAIATSPFMATGRLGGPQIARMAEMLDALRTLFRVVMIHHPPITQSSARHKRLIDAREFRKAIAAVGADLIIHGHDHVHALAWLAGNSGRVPVVGVPSASASAGIEHAGAYNLYRIDGGPGAWRCEVVSRGLRPSGAVTELNRLVLSWSGNG
jgi:3',5'-cyclic AMP phosphodiesterase CpdA